MIEKARQEKLEQLELEVIEGNQRAIGLYHKMGFCVHRRKAQRHPAGGWKLLKRADDGQGFISWRKKVLSGLIVADKTFLIFFYKMTTISERLWLIRLKNPFIIKRASCKNRTDKLVDSSAH